MGYKDPQSQWRTSYDSKLAFPQVKEVFAALGPSACWGSGKAAFQNKNRQQTNTTEGAKPRPRQAAQDPALISAALGALSSPQSCALPRGPSSRPRGFLQAGVSVVGAGSAAGPPRSCELLRSPGPSIINEPSLKDLPSEAPTDLPTLWRKQRG